MDKKEFWVLLDYIHHAPRISTKSVDEYSNSIFSDWVRIEYDAMSPIGTIPWLQIRYFLGEKEVAYRCRYLVVDKPNELTKLYSTLVDMGHLSEKALSTFIRPECTDAKC